MKELFVKAHKMAKEIKAQYPEVDYKLQFSLCLAYLREGENEMVELQGSEKQIAWAKEIKEEILQNLKDKIDNIDNSPKFAKKIYQNFELTCKGKEQIVKEVTDILVKIIAGVEKETSAKRIIDWKSNESYLSKELVEFYGWL